MLLSIMHAAHMPEHLYLGGYTCLEVHNMSLSALRFCAKTASTVLICLSRLYKTARHVLYNRPILFEMELLRERCCIDCTV